MTTSVSRPEYVPLQSRAAAAGVQLATTDYGATFTLTGDLDALAALLPDDTGAHQFPRTVRQDRLAHALDRLAGLTIRAAAPDSEFVPHDPAVLDQLGITAAEYTAAALDLAFELDTTALVASFTLDALAVAFSASEVTR